MTNTRIEADGIVLADFTDTIVNDDVDEQPAFEVVARLRAEEVEVIDRGNVQTTFTFSVGREHKTLIEAQDYRLRFPRRVPRLAALVTITTKDFAGGEKRWYLANAGIRVRRPQATGVYTFADFTVIGGLVKESKA